ncbi:RecQ family ATP-dependent DNA helicase [Filimonas effusa]|uniref:ATP-dependent DNA helicase RecQ n=2 Tax=Filimonas effusa TaxID=2508721 RepID=A0A4V1M9Q2_9BACT|nr:RecQ family ATP-dependent DNA helicase [Filimonas effusa]
MNDARFVLRKYWGYTAFRGLQEKVIEAVLQGRDTLALLPTGGGKSVCYQVPAILNDGICLVISPLIALMKDQVENLGQKGIGAIAIYSGMNNREVRQAFDEAASNREIRLLYISPERLDTLLFSQYVDELDIQLVAVDEAHCISQWGYDFRPAYLRIAQLRDRLPGNVPFLALTASATPLVQEDIIDKLQLKQPAVFRQSFERPELVYRLFRTESKINKLIALLQEIKGSGIVYCGTRRRTQDVTRLLLLQGIQAGFYHAGLPQDERNEKQQAWVNGALRVMVCTNAFGMGIDKPDVRSVIHYDVPDCLENYYQEAGRAGRDGKTAYAVLLFEAQDEQLLLELPDIRYPKLADIQRVYQALADYLQIPVGVGEGVYYDFDFMGLVQHFSLDPRLAINAIRILEQEGHLSFKENVFMVARVMFTSTRTQLEEVERMYPQLELLMKTLLRTYEGIYDNLVPVYEKQLMRLCRLSREQLLQQLQQLERLGVIEYLPQKETPQLHYLLNRAPAAFLNIDLRNYERRKQLYIQRLQAMLGYTRDAGGCRSRYIARYFGQDDAKACGICDVCVAARQSGPLLPEEFNSITQKIKALLSGGAVPIKSLVAGLTPFTEEKSWQVIRFLLSEQKLVMDQAGNVTGRSL